MIKNYLKVAYRSLLRNKAFTAINIFGLSAGIAVFLLILQFVSFEWNSNRFHKNFDRLVRVGTVSKTGEFGYYIPPGYTPVLLEKFPAIESAVRIADGIGAGVISYSGNATAEVKAFREEKMIYADSAFFSAFTFPMSSGIAKLQRPLTMAISASMAQKLFGTQDATGKVVTVSNQFGNRLYTIEGVYRDMPKNSDIQCQAVLSMASLYSKANREDNDWADPTGFYSAYGNSYFLLKPNSNRSALENQITGFLHQTYADTKDVKAVLQPFSHLHLAPGFSYPYQTFGSLPLVTTLFAIALLIIIIAWINYINLSTVQSLRRSRETGVRKVLGATRGELSIQFLAETAFITLISTAIAFLLVQFLQPLYNRFTDRDLSLQLLNSGMFWLICAGVLLIGILMAGGYVAFVLSSFTPINALRGKVETVKQGLSLRKALVVFQFSISVIFIIATVIMFRQLRYMKTANLGVNLESLLVIKGPTVSSEGQAEKNYAFKKEIANLSFVRKVAASNNVPGSGFNFSTEGITGLNPQPGDDKKSYRMFISDNRFFDTYQIAFAQGQAFTEEDANNGWNKARRIILNEKAARALGYSTKDNLIGRKILWGEPFEIVGIVKDYHHMSLRESIEPTIYLPSVSFVYYTIQTDLARTGQNLPVIEKLYKQYFAGNPFEYFFADESYQRQYESDQKLANVCIAAAITAILIACLGLFGLAAFSATQRVKEIGIRKVLGASVQSITTMLCKDFIILVSIGILIAMPIAGWMMSGWLDNFAYRVPLTAGVFIAAACIALFIAAMTIGTQAVKAARNNPVNSLRGD